MITDVFVGGLLGILRGLVSLLPTYELPMDDLTTSAEVLGGAAAFASVYFPLGSLVAAVGMVVAVRVGLFAWHAVRDLWDALPFT